MQPRLTLFLLFSFSLCVQPTHDHLKDFQRRLIGRDALIKATVMTLFNEARNSPREWARGIDGFGKRAGSLMTRLKHAVASTYWVPRDNGPGYTLAAGRIAGTFTESQVARLWMPDRVNTMGAAMQSTAGAAGLDVGVNIFREFWPRPH